MFGFCLNVARRHNFTLTMGDMGSKVLPPSDPKLVPNWKIGTTPRVAWGMRFNHGGGEWTVAFGGCVVVECGFVECWELIGCAV
jgi:hypothetical protein